MGVYVLYQFVLLSVSSVGLFLSGLAFADVVAPMAR